MDDRTSRSNGEAGAISEPAPSDGRSPPVSGVRRTVVPPPFAESPPSTSAARAPSHRYAPRARTLLDAVSEAVTALDLGVAECARPDPVDEVVVAPWPAFQLARALAARGLADAARSLAETAVLWSWGRGGLVSIRGRSPVGHALHRVASVLAPARIDVRPRDACAAVLRAVDGETELWMLNVHSTDGRVDSVLLSLPEQSRQARRSGGL